MTNHISNPWKKDFPIFHQKSRGKPLVFLDSAASAQKPQCVLDKTILCYATEYANVHRAVYELSEQLSTEFEAAREKVANFIGAKSSQEIVFTKGTTESINLVAHGIGKVLLQAGDNIVISCMEHHSNLVPWQVICGEKSAELRVARINEKGELDLEHYASLLDLRTKIVAMAHVSNVLGTINPVEKIVALAHEKNIPVLFDGAQAIPHLSISVEKLDCDFYVFSGHKLYGPTGVGVMYGKREWLKKLPPYQTGGGMIHSVEFSGSTYAGIPAKFEAGTPPIVEAVGLATAIEYLEDIGCDTFMSYQEGLSQYFYEKLLEIPELHLLAHPEKKVGVFSFTIKNMHAYDVGLLLDADGIAVRTGHHCTMPLHHHLGIDSSIRASLGLYNDYADVDICVDTLKKTISRFHGDSK